MKLGGPLLLAWTSCDSKMPLPVTAPPLKTTWFVKPAGLTIYPLLTIAPLIVVLKPSLNCKVPSGLMLNVVAAGKESVLPYAYWSVPDSTTMLFAANVFAAFVSFTVPLPRFVTVSPGRPPTTFAFTVNVDEPRLTKSALPESVRVSADVPQVYPPVRPAPIPLNGVPLVAPTIWLAFAPVTETPAEYALYRLPPTPSPA